MQDPETRPLNGGREAHAPSPRPSPAPAREGVRAIAPDYQELPAEPAQEDVLAATQPWLRRLNHDNQAQLLTDMAILKKMALDDKHEVLGATHVVELDGEIIGYASVGSIPMVNLWLSSKSKRPATAIAMLNQVENEAARCGFRVVCVPCGMLSPFRKLMKRFGYAFKMQSGFFTKTLRG